MVQPPLVARRIAEIEFLDDRVRYAPGAKTILRSRAGRALGEEPVESTAKALVQLEEGPLFFFVVAGSLLLLEGDSGLFGELFHRLREAQLLELHEELNRRTASLASEAIVEAFIGVDVEGGTLLRMEGT